MTEPTDAQRAAFTALLAATGWSAGALAAHLAVLGLDPATAGALTASAEQAGVVGVDPARGGGAIVHRGTGTSAGLFQFAPSGTYRAGPPRRPAGDPLGLDDHLARRHRRHTGPAFRPDRAAADALDTGNALGATRALPAIGPARYRDGTTVGSRVQAAVARAAADRQHWERPELRQTVHDEIAARVRRAADRPPPAGAHTLHTAGLPEGYVPPSASLDPPAATDPNWAVVPGRLGAAARAFGRDAAAALRRWRAGR